MFAHRKISGNHVDDEWLKIKQTIDSKIAYRAAVTLGAYSTEDMLEFADLTKSDINRVYVKHDDGQPVAYGIRKVLPRVDVTYIHTERRGLHNEKVEIRPLDAGDEETIQSDESEIVWFADPIVARGTTTIGVLRYLRNSIPFEIAVLSHVVANITGISAIQTQITDFHSDSYMNYAFQSQKINQATGFLEDALEVIPDFGDKVFGRIGADYPVYLMQESIRNLLGTKAGDVEILKGIIMFLLQRHGSDEYKVDRKVKWATREWIKQAILWYMKLRGIPVNIEVEKHFDIIMDELENVRHAIGYKNIPYKNGYAQDYYITEAGYKVSTAAYVPILVELGITRIILKDLDNFLLYLSARDISKLISDSSGA